MSDEWSRVRTALDAAGVRGTEDVGRFVNDTTYLEPSRLDERSAAPMLLEMLPTLNDPKVVAAVGRHLQGPWLRKMDGAYGRVRDAYTRWAGQPGEAGWVLADTLCRAAVSHDGQDMVSLASDDRGGIARQPIVEALWRFKELPEV